MTTDAAALADFVQDRIDRAMYATADTPKYRAIVAALRQSPAAPSEAAERLERHLAITKETLAQAPQKVADIIDRELQRAISYSPDSMDWLLKDVKSAVLSAITLGVKEQVSALRAQPAAGVVREPSAAILDKALEEFHGTPNWAEGCSDGYVLDQKARMQLALQASGAGTGVDTFQWAKWIARHRGGSFYGDHACEQCFPGQTMKVKGRENEVFVCVYHQAEAVLQQSEEGRALLSKLTEGRA